MWVQNFSRMTRCMISSVLVSTLFWRAVSQSCFFLFFWEDLAGLGCGLESNARDEGLIARVVDPSDVSRLDRDAYAGDDGSQK